jgi:nitrate reductase alpha subunit
MIGGTILSFNDWYADMPIASPQVFGDQTDVPESGDWWNASYLMIWGTNLPITRTPDAHFMTEARYRGQKVVVVSPDFSDHTKFADDWLPAAPGTDGALAMAMGHVILSEFYRDRQVPYFTDYVKTYTDLPFLVTLREGGDAYVPDRFLTAADIGETGEGAAHKPCCSTPRESRESRTARWASATARPVRAGGTSTWARSTRCSRFPNTSPKRWPWTCRASTSGKRRAARPYAEVCRRSGWAGAWLPWCSTCCWRSTRCPAPGCPVSGRRDTTMITRTPRYGRSGSHLCPPRQRSGWLASSRKTPSCHTAGR